MTIRQSLPDGTPPHGGDVYLLARALGVRLADLLDFSANINPLGYPPGLPGAIAAALPNLVHYPDRRCLDLRQDLARSHDLTPEEILVGNGSAELIFLVARALNPSRALIVAPAFSEYQEALEASRVPFEFHLTAEADRFTLAEFPENPIAGLVFLANPASPSGALIPPERLLPWLEKWDAAGIFVALDEAFIDFVEGASAKVFLRRFPRLIILRSFTKFFAIPGLRLGYLLAAPDLTAKLAVMQEPWSVNTLAQAAGRACLADLDYMAQTRAFVAAARENLLAGLKALPGLTPFPGEANYLLVRIDLPGWTARRLREALLPRGIIIRDASNFTGLDARYFRLAVRRPEDNQRLLTALAACLHPEQP